MTTYQLRSTLSRPHCSMWGERDTTSDHLQTILRSYTHDIKCDFYCKQTPTNFSLYAILILITEMSILFCASIVYPCQWLIGVQSSQVYNLYETTRQNTSFKMTTYVCTRDLSDLTVTYTH